MNDRKLFTLLRAKYGARRVFTHRRTSEITVELNESAAVPIIPLSELIDGCSKEVEKLESLLASISIPAESSGVVYVSHGGEVDPIQLQRNKEWVQRFIARKQEIIEQVGSLKAKIRAAKDLRGSLESLANRLDAGVLALPLEFKDIIPRNPKSEEGTEEIANVKNPAEEKKRVKAAINWGTKRYLMNQKIVVPKQVRKSRPLAREAVEKFLQHLKDRDRKRMIDRIRDAIAEQSKRELLKRKKQHLKDPPSSV